MQHKQDDDVKVEEQEEDHEGKDTDSVNTYVKKVIMFEDDDEERTPHATLSPKGKVTLKLWYK